MTTSSSRGVHLRCTVEVELAEVLISRCLINCPLFRLHNSQWHHLSYRLFPLSDSLQQESCSPRQWRRGHTHRTFTHLQCRSAQTRSDRQAALSLLDMDRPAPHFLLAIRLPWAMRPAKSAPPVTRACTVQRTQSAKAAPSGNPARSAREVRSCQGRLIPPPGLQAQRNRTNPPSFQHRFVCLATPGLPFLCLLDPIAQRTAHP